MGRDDSRSLAASLRAYQSGDLNEALAEFPTPRNADSEAIRTYHAALLLSVGQLTDAETLPISTNSNSQRLQRLRRAMLALVAAVKHQTISAIQKPELATEFLALSYFEQSQPDRRNSLLVAREMARRAVERSPDFGFAWERLAELEFSFGDNDATLKALNRSLALAPRNAQAFALKGFVLASLNRAGEAMEWFEKAVESDPALGNAWLGRGLCRIRNGNLQAGRADLLIAAALEPRRSELRSYLGKAYARSGNDVQAVKELKLAEELDPADPTPWLYSALLNQQNGRINEAIRDLDKSKFLNDNRSVYRSDLLLDQDSGVRSANLASMYEDAGMTYFGIKEASRAVGSDYANYSAHLFLANSYNNLIDPNEINLRYQTAMENEYLLANLLSPAVSGTMSPSISQQEYSHFFDEDGLGFASETDYMSRGAWNEGAAQFGVTNDFSYSIEESYHSDKGQAPNAGFEYHDFVSAIKKQIDARDTLYLSISDYNADGGDAHQYYDPNSANQRFHFTEMQDPTFALGYDREWSLGNHTLALFSRINDALSFTNAAQPTLVAFRPEVTFGSSKARHLTTVQGITMNDTFENTSDIYSGEVQQIIETPQHSTIIGGRL